MSDTIFDKILAGTIAARKVFEDDATFAFHDILPQAPVHVLVIPKRKLVSIAHANNDDTELLGRVLQSAKLVAQQLGLDKTGYRVVFNTGEDAGQSVPYLHAHVLGGRALGWPPG